jgi:hypothetical protein
MSLKQGKISQFTLALETVIIDTKIVLFFFHTFRCRVAEEKSVRFQKKLMSHYNLLHYLVHNSDPHEICQKSLHFTRFVRR